MAAYVIDVGALCSINDIPKAYQELDKPMSGESHIINPFGEVVAGPAKGETILIADGSLEQVYAAKADCDVAGHYSRPDIFQLHIKRTPSRHLIEMPD
jgi:predicted amidohydrolase